jgi:ParB family chromosome partitioning protein
MEQIESRSARALDAEPEAAHDALVRDDCLSTQHGTFTRSTRSSTRAASSDGHPLVVPLDRLYEDPNNPRTEFPESELDELADDIRERGILQPLVVHPADAAGCHRIHFGAKRLRAAKRAGLHEVPVVIRTAAADSYAQVAENQKRHGLTPLDLARFMRAKVDEGESNATIAKRLGINLTTVAHHLSLLELPPELNEALKSGRCTSPRTLHELSKLHDEQPERVNALIAGSTEITRNTVAAMRTVPVPAVEAEPKSSHSTTPLAQANAICARLELALDRLKKTDATSTVREASAVVAERHRIERDLHDGAQQRVIALRMKLSVAARLLLDDPRRAAQLVAELDGDVDALLVELRGLAQGLVPPLLLEQGLGAALREAAHRAAIRTRVEIDEVGRCDPAVELAVYFCCLEALQNAAKHAGPGATALLTLRRHMDSLEFSVSDDGLGMAATEPAVGGQGFANMRERIEGVGGRLEIKNLPGKGVCVAGEVVARGASMQGRPAQVSL